MSENQSNQTDESEAEESDRPAEDGLKELAKEVEIAVSHIRGNRPNDPEAVSYALDDLQVHTSDIQSFIEASDSALPELSELTDTMEDTVNTIRENRPDDPETVSYALDDLEKQISDLYSLTSE
jgi:uncharacterized protein YdhG (YjbR/CyaY superfamily)